MATPFPFVAGAVLTAANLNAITELVTNTQTNDYTLAATDAGDRVIANKATAIVFTVPNNVFSASQIVRIHNIGVGTLTISAGAGLTLNGADVLTLAQYQGGELFFTSASSAIFFPTAKTVSAGGLTLISSTTIGSAVSTITVSNVFSSTFDNYHVIMSGGVADATRNITLQLGSSVTGYYQFSVYGAYNSATITGEEGNNGNKWDYVGRGTTNSLMANFTLIGPNLAKNTFITFQSATSATTAHVFVASGYLADNTQHTGFTFTVGGGNATGGTIKVYGYQN